MGGVGMEEEVGPPLMDDDEEGIGEGEADFVSSLTMDLPPSSRSPFFLFFFIFPPPPPPPPPPSSSSSSSFLLSVLGPSVAAVDVGGAVNWSHMYREGFLSND